MISPVWRSPPRPYRYARSSSKIRPTRTSLNTSRLENQPDAALYGKYVHTFNHCSTFSYTDQGSQVKGTVGACLFRGTGSSRGPSQRLLPAGGGVRQCRHRDLPRRSVRGEPVVPGLFAGQCHCSRPSPPRPSRRSKARPSRRRQPTKRGRWPRRADFRRAAAPASSVVATSKGDAGPAGLVESPATPARTHIVAA